MNEPELFPGFYIPKMARKEELLKTLHSFGVAAGVMFASPDDLPAEAQEAYYELERILNKE